MSFSASLNLSGKTYRVLHVDYDFTQPTDQRGEPRARPVSGFINVLIESSRESEPIEWMMSHSMRKDGDIVFNRSDVASEMRKLSFKDAYCVYYKEVFDFSGENPMTIFLRISPKEITINGSHKITQNWVIAGGEGGGGASSASQSAPPPASGSGNVSPFIAD